MDRREFMQELSKRTGLTQVLLNSIFDSAVDIMVEELKAGNRIVFNNLGIFSSKKVGERRLVSPQGKVVVKKAGRAPVFKFTKVFKERMEHGGTL